ncbi:hypothetical protein JTE90_009052 [Oedothorax gibbosus]|uniref:MARVEL domain-containing protein n=1 Tax=Oedothorax gibbosus TaxID=931172 RepID=A0AAV6VIV7_9ARAC|nr:hypothetical protein JTE90_009052 [Oedothorax gibbosus]
MQHAVKVPGCCEGLCSKFPAVPLDLNLPFLQSVPGIFKIAHTTLGLICLIVIGCYVQFTHPITGSSLGLLCSKSDAYFLLVTYGCFVTSFLLLVCSIISYFTASFLPKTAFEFVYHLTACLMYLTASLTLLCVLLATNAETGGYREPGFDAKVAVSVLGIINSVLYGVSTYFSFQSFRQMS